jgi:hypothetical protein
MASVVGRKFSSWFKDLLKISNSNSGLTTSAQEVYDGLGNKSALKLSKDHVNIQPQNANTTSTFKISNLAGGTRFEVDTTNTTAKFNSVHLNTMSKRWSCFDISPTQGAHHVMALGGAVGSEDSGSADWAPTSLGTGTDPATTLSTAADAAVNILPAIWWLDYSINIDSVTVLAQAAASTDLNFHIMKYTMATGSGAGAGDFSSGAVVCDGSALAVDDDRIVKQAMTIGTSAVAVNSVLVCTVENVGGTDDVSATVEMTYHITGS